MKKNKNESRRVEELEDRVEELEEEVERLKRKIPPPPALKPGAYRGTIVDAVTKTTQMGRTVVQLKIGKIDGFPDNVVWHTLTTERRRSRYDQLRLDLGTSLTWDSRWDENTDDPADLVGKRVELGVRYSSFERVAGRDPRHPRLNEVTSIKASFR